MLKYCFIQERREGREREKERGERERERGERERERGDKYKTAYVVQLQNSPIPYLLCDLAKGQHVYKACLRGSVRTPRLQPIIAL